jgi:flagellar L-ring protein precursor FlgH
MNTPDLGDTMRYLLGLALIAIAGCDRLEQVGKAPGFTQSTTGNEYYAMMSPGLPTQADPDLPAGDSSLWAASRESLLGDRRAEGKGDILTVVIQIDDSAQISNSSKRSRSGSESLGVPSLLGIPQRVDQALPDGASLADAVSIRQSSGSSGSGSVSRNERLTLRVAATVVGVLPNGVLEIAGTQEVRVNYELRELLITGYVRPEDVSRQNEVTYDKIASARISYGGRGQISDVQQPRYGQQVADIVLPF